MDEEKLAKEFETYQQLASQDKKIDLASLMISALEKQQGNLLSDKEKRWAYLISLFLPPFGLLFAARFYLSAKDDGEHSAWICGILTAVSILLAIVFTKILFSGSGASLNQIQQINPQDLQQFLQ